MPEGFELSAEEKIDMQDRILKRINIMDFRGF